MGSPRKEKYEWSAPRRPSCFYSVSMTTFARTPFCHARAGGHPCGNSCNLRKVRWIPAFAGMTKRAKGLAAMRSEEHTSELQSLMRISYAVFCLKKKSKYTVSEQNIPANIIPMLAHKSKYNTQSPNTKV